MNWLQQILALLGSSASGDPGSGNATPQIAGAGPAPDLTGSGTSPGPSTTENQNATSAAQGTAGLSQALGQIDLSKLFPQQHAAQGGGGHLAPLAQLPQFPVPQQQPSLQGLMAAIQARRQRLAQLGVGG